MATELNDKITQILHTMAAGIEACIGGDKVDIDLELKEIAEAREAIQRLIVEARIDEIDKYLGAVSIGLSLDEYRAHRREELQASLNTKQESK